MKGRSSLKKKCLFAELGLFCKSCCCWSAGSSVCPGLWTARSPRSLEGGGKRVWKPPGDSECHQPAPTRGCCQRRPPPQRPGPGAQAADADFPLVAAGSREHWPAHLPGWQATAFSPRPYLAEKRLLVSLPLAIRTRIHHGGPPSCADLNPSSSQRP